MHPGYRSPDARHRPVFSPAPGRAGLPCSFFPQGACGTTGVSPRPRRHVRTHGLRVRKHTATTNSLGRRSSPAFRTRMDFSACCITDRELSLAPTPPGPCELSHGHALGPSARRVGVNLLSDCGSPAFARNLAQRADDVGHVHELAAFRPDIVAATASRCHVTMTIATRPLPERDG